MKQLLSIAAVFAVLAFGSFAFAQEEQQSKAAQKMKAYEAYAQGDSEGVVYKQFDKNSGKLTDVLVVGRAHASTVFGASRGRIVAARKASMSCDANFVQWCKKNLKVREGGNYEEITEGKGVESDDENSLTEEGKNSDKYSREIVTYAEGIVRGMEIVYSKLDSEKKQYIVIKRWSKKGSDAAKTVAKDLSSDDNDDNSSLGSVNNGNTAEKSKGSRKGEFKDETYVAPEVDDLF